MPAVKIKPDVYWVGANDRTTDLFEGLWPIVHEGVSYNSYLINDEKTAVIDLIKSLKTDEFLAQIDEVTDVSKVDYVVMNHLEPDHSGMVRTFRRVAPNATILGSQKMKEMLESFYGITENVKVVEDGETLSLGKRTIKFFSAPFVHWPETIVTYEEADRILFSCDAFGGYGALRGGIFDDQCTDFYFYEREALRYYVNIVAIFSQMVLNAIKKLKGLPIDIIAPSHGLIWRKDPKRIIDLYKKWAEYSTGDGEAGITLIYGSMYGNTEKMMNAVAHGISCAGVPLEIFDVARTPVSYILPSLWTKRGVMIGAPTYENKLFPLMAHALDIVNRKRIINKKVARFGSFGWSGGAQREFEKIIEPLKWELIDSFEFTGSPTKDDLKKGEEFGAKFAEAIKGS
ncbi:MAG TPA: FprA family A-type flavoprotein [Nitrospinota bacterium]|nr:FprA family A-type flavoprotein [Nitrospinota bacterium]